ncbi:MAG: toll/interleukin-1 receptor domain-containing protein [Acidobacteriia bacterium]|nr:toll/interleukin-1 receptor domain-containing protein [Terriglobia bacterium]
MGTGRIFLSHAGADTQAARQFAEILRRNDVDVWFDKDDLQPGGDWQATLEEAIAQATGMIVYVGSSGVEDWVEREVRYGLVRNTDNRETFRFIPVLGEGANLAGLPPFVQQHQCVDLRDRERAPEQIRRLVEVLRQSSSETAIPAGYWTGHSPFRSLRSFGPEDSWLFFGRDDDTGELLSRLGRAPAWAVIGNSGSGKSSLIQAGLIPALRRGRFRSGGNWVDSWRIAVFRPPADPFDYLAEVLPGQLAELSLKDRAEFIGYCKEKLPEGGGALRDVIAALVNPADQTFRGTHILLVADQFEELFTLVPGPATRSRYIDSLLAAARLDGAVPVHLVLGLRADFYANCLDHPNLSAALATNLYNVPAMTHLREAIENRLALAGARAEPGLVDSLLAEAGAEPGNLALLEHALAQLWEKCGGSGGTLTGGAYADIGRLKGALGRHADEVYHDLDEDDQLLAQRIFLELVQLGEGAQDTRRRVAKESLLHLGAREQVERLIAHLASKLLLATSGEGPQAPKENFVEVSHEALIREWLALRKWLEDNRGRSPSRPPHSAGRGRMAWAGKRS